MNIICPDCGHEAEYHNPLQDGCVLGDCKCRTYDSEIYLTLLTEAVKLLEPFAEEPVSDLDKDTDRDEFSMEVGHFRKASTFLKNVKRLPLEADLQG